MIIRKILTFHLATLMLVSNVGIPVYRHICHTQAKSWSSIYIPAKSCCSKKKNKTITSPCHPSGPENKAELKGMPCCENQEGFLQLGIDFLRMQTENESAGSVMSFEGVFNLTSTSPVQFHSSSFPSNKPHGPPLILYGRSLLISQQVFRC
jgi:hypothetical protein